MTAVSQDKAEWKKFEKLPFKNNNLNRKKSESQIGIYSQTN